MFTTCPHCTLLMAVMVGDLRQGQGYVRCCGCYSIFNALATLTVDGPATARAVERLDAALPAGAPVIIDANDPVDGTSTTGEYPMLPAELLDTLATADDPATPVPTPQAQATVTPAPVTPAPVPPAPEPAPQSGPATAPPSFITLASDENQPASRRALWAWRILAVAMACLLAALLVHRFRQRLVEVPPLTQPMGHLYRWLGQTLEPHWDLGALEVRVLQAQSMDSDPPRLQLTVSIANQGRQSIPLPVLRLRLSDRFGTHVGQRTLAPVEYQGDTKLRYLPPGQRLDREITVPNPGGVAEGYEIDACLTLASGALQCPPEPTSP